MVGEEGKPMVRRERRERLETGERRERDWRQERGEKDWREEREIGERRVSSFGIRCVAFTLQSFLEN